MTRWYRAYEGTVTDAKLGEVALVAGCSKSVAIAAWHCILESAATSNSGGAFDATPRRVAVILGEQPTLIEKVFAEYVALGMLTEGKVTAWSKRQYESDSSTERSRKSRERAKSAPQQERNADATLQQQDATPPETDTETKTERERENARAQDPKHWEEVQGYLKDYLEALSDWERDFLHSVKWKETLTKDQSESLKAIRGKLKSSETNGQQVFLVKQGTPQFSAWIAHKKAQGLKTAFMENQPVLSVPSLFPPEATAA